MTAAPAPAWLRLLRTLHAHSDFTTQLEAAFNDDKSAARTMRGIGVGIIRARHDSPSWEIGENVAGFAHQSPVFPVMLQGTPWTRPGSWAVVLKTAPTAMRWPGAMRFPWGVSRITALSRDIALLAPDIDQAPAHPLDEPPLMRELGNPKALGRRYHTRPKRLEALYERQHGRCAVCDRSMPLAADHCHDTGLVRGFLCQQCNTAAGQLKDSPVLAQRLTNYLRGETNQ
jgi:hypothetical protein